MLKQTRRNIVFRSGAAALFTLGVSGRAGAQGAQPLDVVKLITGFPPPAGPPTRSAAASPRV